MTSVESKEYRLVGYCCSMCEWKLEHPLEQWQALPEFGKHNLSKHYGTMQAHIVPTMGWVKITEEKDKKKLS